MLFQNWFNWGRESRKANIEAKTQAAEALKKEAEARNAHAEAERFKSMTQKVEQAAEFEKVKAGMSEQFGEHEFERLVGKN